MTQQWYLSRQGERYGPYSWDQLRGFTKTGHLVADDLVWSEGMAGWVKADEVDGLLEAGPTPDRSTPPAPPVPPEGFSTHQQTESSNPTRPAEAPGVEKMAGIIPAMQRKTGMFSTKLYNLVLTEQRIIFAEATAQMLKQAVKDAAAEAKAEGKGFLARAADTFKSSQRIYQKYWKMAPEDILAETAGNFAIELHGIASIKIVRHGGLKIGLSHNDQDYQKKDEMHIKTGREKINLIFQQGNSAEAKKLLQGLLGKKVR